MPKQTVAKEILKRPRIRPWSVVVVLVSIVGIYLLLPQLSQLRGIIPVVKHAAWWWVVAGVATTVLGFLAAAYTQFMAGRSRGSFYFIVLLQLTGAFINHFLPFNLGSVSLTARYYGHIGESRTRAIAISLLPSIFGIITTVCMIAIMSPVTLRHMVQHAYKGSLNIWFIAIAAIVILGMLIAIPYIRRRIRGFVREVITAVTSISLWPQLPALLLGSLALTFVSTISLMFSAYAVHASINVLDAFTLYVTSSLVSNFAPTPGGIGATEAFLALGLTSVGMSLPEAFATTLVFRFVSFWVPLIPGAIAFRMVNHSRQAGGA